MNSNFLTKPSFNETSLVNKLSRENAQLHGLSEKLARVVRKLLNNADTLDLLTQEDKEALNAYEKFKEDVIWNTNNPPI